MSKKRDACWHPNANWQTTHKSEIRAIQAVWAGAANKGQQQKALSFILTELSDRDGNQFYLDSRETDFALGKKFVGDMIAGAIHAKLGTIKE